MGEKVVFWLFLTDRIVLCNVVDVTFVDFSQSGEGEIDQNKETGYDNPSQDETFWCLSQGDEAMAGHICLSLSLSLSHTHTHIDLELVLLA